MHKIAGFISVLLLFLFPVFGISQQYKNPVIPGFYPDPSVCKAGMYYYLVNSSFEYFPGIPVWRSKDLVHWEQIGNVLNRASQLPLHQTKPSNGIYAPTIRYHNGLFYVVVTLVSDNKGYKNFYVTAQNPAGPWSDPVFVDQNGIDPSLFFDDDGRVYFLSNRATKPSDERAIYQSEIDITSGKRISAIQQIWKGSGGSYVEGPHMYKKDGYYYLLTAEGGTAYGHTVAISRSKNIWGPYESCPHNPILTNRMSYSIIQGTGHGDLIQDNDGNWWMVHLAFRPAVDGIHFIGRETCLTPVEWKENEWPVVNKNGNADETVNIVPSGFQQQLPQPFSQQVFTDFNVNAGYEWIYMRNPDSLNYVLNERKGWLRLKGNKYNLNEWESPAFIARRQQHFNFQASTLIAFDPKNSNEEAGLTVLMDNRFHYDFFISSDNRGRVLNVRYRLDSLHQLYKQVPIPAGEITMMVEGNKYNYTFFWKGADKSFQKIATLNTRFLGTEVSGGYNGVVIGLYATGNGKASTANADFDWFLYKPM